MKVLRVLIVFILFSISSYLLVYNMFSGYDFVYTQDTFLRVRADIEQALYIWKDREDLGKFYIDHGYWFYYVIIEIMENIGFNHTLSEFFYLFLLILIVHISSFYSFLKIFKLKISSLRSTQFLFLILITFIYIYNAYNFTVTFYLIENWTAYALIMPLSYLIIHDVIIGSTGLKMDYLLFFILTVLFNYGYQGPFLVVTVLLAVLYYIICLLLVVEHRASLKHLLKKFFLLILLLLLPGLPYLIVNEFTLGLRFWDPNILHNEYNLYEFMLAQSSTTSLFNVFTFQGFVWLKTPSLFPWYYDTHIRIINVILTIIGWCVMAGSSIIILKRGEHKDKKFVLSWFVLLIIVIFIMKTLQPPFGEILYYLVLTHIPIFYLFINPYYFVGQWLVFGYTVLLAFNWLTLGTYKYVNDKHKIKYRIKSIKPRNIPRNILEIIFIMLIISYWVTLLLNGMIYPDPNIEENYLKYAHSINIPNDLFELNNIVEHNLRALFIPPTLNDGIAYYWTFNNRTIVDVGTFRYSVLDFNVITGSPINWLALKYIDLRDCDALARLMAIFNVKYIVLNGYSEVLAKLYRLNLSKYESVLDSCRSLRKTFVSEDGKLIAYEFSANTSKMLLWCSTRYITIYKDINFSNSVINAHIRGNDISLAANPLYPNMLLDSNVLLYLIENNIPLLFNNTDIMDEKHIDKFMNNLQKVGVNENVLRGNLVINKAEREKFLTINFNNRSIVILQVNISYSDTSVENWKILIIALDNGNEIHIQIFSNDRGSALSIQYYKDRELEAWANVDFNTLPLVGNVSIYIILTHHGVDVFLYEISKGMLYYDYLPLQSITAKSADFYAFFVNSNATLYYNLFRVINDKNDEYCSLENVEKISPTLWRANVTSKKPFVLIFTQSYDPLWEADVYRGERLIERIKPVPVYGVVNGFWINESGNLSVVIRYIPQDWYEFGLKISGSTSVLCIFYLVWDWRRGRGDRWALMIEKSLRSILRRR